MDNPDTNKDIFPPWFNGKDINEAVFCEEFLRTHRIIYSGDSFYTPDGRVTDDLPLRGKIFQELKDCASKNIPRTITNILELMKLSAQVEDFAPVPDEIYLQNGTLHTNGWFEPGRCKVVPGRFPISYDPQAPQPRRWISFLNDLLYEDDIPTLQEYIGYCLIPSSKGQRMMIIKGNGGEGKSQIGTVLDRLFGINRKDGNIGKISENRFARADLEHILLCVDDDMRMEALRNTNYVKSIVTSQGKMDLEKKGRQSYQGWMYCRLLAFSNGDLQSLYDRSNGFYRRQLILTTKERPPNRRDDPYIADKMCAELEGIFLWAFVGLKRLIANNFVFTESERTRSNREYIRHDSNNILDFLDSEGFFRFKADCSVSSKDFYDVYRIWCEENALEPLRCRTFSAFLIANESKYSLEYSNNSHNASGRRVRGFEGIELLIDPYTSGTPAFEKRTYVPD